MATARSIPQVRIRNDRAKHDEADAWDAFQDAAQAGRLRRSLADDANYVHLKFDAERNRMVYVCDSEDFRSGCLNCVLIALLLRPADEGVRAAAYVLVAGQSARRPLLIPEVA